MPIHARNVFRFRLSSLFLAVGLSALSFVGIRRWLDRRPIQWIPYSQQALEQQFGSSLPVLVFVGADWDMNSLVVSEVTLEDPKLVKVMRNRSAVAFYAEYGRGDPEVVSFLKRVGGKSTPTVVVYPDGVAESPVVLHDLTYADEVIMAFRSAQNAHAIAK